MGTDNTTNGTSESIQRRLRYPEAFDAASFFRTGDGRETLTGPADLESTVPNDQKRHLTFEDQYWTNCPYAFVSIWRNERHEEVRYYVVEPTLSDTERKLLSFLREKLRFAIDYEAQPTEVSRRRQEEIIGQAAVDLLDRFNLLERRDVEGVTTGPLTRVRDWLTSLVESQVVTDADAVATPELTPTSGSTQLDDAAVKRLLYYLRRDFVWYGVVDPIKRDVHVEDISCDGYDSPVFVYHADRGGQLVTNRTLSADQLDEFVVNMAQRAGQGISRREPDVNATLPDGSRAQLTLGEEISDHGTNFTIRQFRDVPFTPIDLLHWGTFSLEQLAYLWLAVENHQSAIVAGGTASGKTTTLNALSLFMPADEKIVSIENTRELEMPQRNWVASTTREAYGRDDSDIDEFDLLKDALRQRPDYIVVGEVRGEEGRDLLQTMNTGHTTYTTFHAGETLEVIRRFTEEPIDAAESMFEGVDLVLNQVSTTVDGTRQRRNRSIEEIGSYDASADAFSVTDAFSWDPEADRFHADHAYSSPVLEDIQRQNGWSEADLRAAIERRKLVLAALSDRGVTGYAGVAATLQAFMSTPSSVLSRIATGTLRESLDDLTGMRAIDVEVGEEREALVPRPTLDRAAPRTRAAVEETLADGEDLLDQFRDAPAAVGVAGADPSTDHEQGATHERAGDDGSEGDSETPIAGPPPDDDGAATVATGDEDARSNGASEDDGDGLDRLLQ
jgi:flagellar protein FlaI